MTTTKMTIDKRGNKNSRRLGFDRSNDNTGCFTAQNEAT